MERVLCPLVGIGRLKTDGDGLVTVSVVISDSMSCCSLVRLVVLVLLGGVEGVRFGGWLGTAEVGLGWSRATVLVVGWLTCLAKS